VSLLNEGALQRPAMLFLDKQKALSFAYRAWAA
jgi:hypothetical protein